MTSYSYLKHPLIGQLLLVANPTELIGIYFADSEDAPANQRDWKLDPAQPILKETAKQLEDYFDGRRTTFSIPLHFSGTDFQCKVWEQLQAIPYSKTISYFELATRVGNSRATRAVGSANGKNPFCIVVPCHRVIAKDGTIGGYGGGLDRKRRLLALERKV